MADPLVTISGMKDRKPKAVPGERPGYPIFARLRSEIGEALEAYLDSQWLRPSKTKLIEKLLSEFLARQGFPPTTR